MVQVLIFNLVISALAQKVNLTMTYPIQQWQTNTGASGNKLKVVTLKFYNHMYKCFIEEVMYVLYGIRFVWV